jgi:hypothetical protein
MDSSPAVMETASSVDCSVTARRIALMVPTRTHVVSFHFSNANRWACSVSHPKSHVDQLIGLINQVIDIPE